MMVGATCFVDMLACKHPHGIYKKTWLPTFLTSPTHLFLTPLSEAVEPWLYNNHLPQVFPRLLVPGTIYGSLNIMAVKIIVDVKDTIYQDTPWYHPLPLSNGTTPPRRQYWSSPTAWEDQVLYFLLPDRFSRANDTNQRPYKPKDKGNAVESEQAAQSWRDAGKNWVGGTLDGVKQAWISGKARCIRSVGGTCIQASEVASHLPWLWCAKFPGD